MNYILLNHLPNLPWANPSIKSFKLSLFFLFLTFGLHCFAQNNLGFFEQHEDIGHPKLKGNTKYDPASQTYTLRGSGYNIWFNRDEFQFAYKKIKGDFILTANFAFISGNEKGSEHQKMGWMVRESDDEYAVNISACSHIDGLTVLQWRGLRGAFMRDPEDEIFAPKKGGEIIQLERSGKTFIMRIAHPGEPLQVVGTHRMNELKDEVLAGLFICSHDSSSYTEAKVWNVRIDYPISGDEYNSSPSAKVLAEPEEQGCRMETIHIADGMRKVILESKSRFEAPNWMPNGKTLLFNANGSLYKIPVTGGDTLRLNTGNLKNNNNDHCISFDGKMLGISNHREGLNGGGSTVYVLPLTGGIPRQITTETPSYLHGWNPNGKEVAIVAQRNGKQVYNLYKVSLKDGKETPLTHNLTGHVDGPEYSPDGKFIYYNANPTGTMQIWRMKADGSGQEQLTFDDYNNWFPHLSPNGKWMVFISFPDSINPNEHPSYKRVMLRLMPVTGGAPRVLAYLYGGQGTMNVNSWSPDNENIAFVSNSGK